MVRQTLHRTISKTTIVFATVELVDGEPKVSNKEEREVLGRVSADKALHLLQKEGLTNVTVLEVKPVNEKYRMSIEEFMKHAELVTDDSEDEEE